MKRDDELNDTRRTCRPIIGRGCQHYKPGRCNNAARAWLVRKQPSAEIGGDFASLPQHCPGYLERQA
jgi:hypothetical protein